MKTHHRKRGGEVAMLAYTDDKFLLTLPPPSPPHPAARCMSLSLPLNPDFLPPWPSCPLPAPPPASPPRSMRRAERRRGQQMRGPPAGCPVGGREREREREEGGEEGMNITWLCGRWRIGSQFCLPARGRKQDMLVSLAADHMLIGPTHSCLSLKLLLLSSPPLFSPLLSSPLLSSPFPSPPLLTRLCASSKIMTAFRRLSADRLRRFSLSTR